MRFSPRALGARLRVLGPDGASLRQGLVALALNSSTSLVAGAILGSLTDTFERLPGLLVLVPAAVGLRGNVFSALGSRLSTAIHAGQFRPTLRPGTLVGDNVAASLLLTAGVSLALAVIAKAVAVAFSLPTIAVVDLAMVSVVGGMLASGVVLAATVALARGAARYGWDLDNLVAPVVSTLGDVLTLPALWLATFLIGHDTASAVAAWVIGAVVVVTGVRGIRSSRRMLRTIVRQSWPVLVTAGLLSTFAGIVIEKRLATFTSYAALLVVVPAFVSSAGAIGGILASRYGSHLHLGTMRPTGFPPRVARQDAAFVAVLAVPVYLFNAVGAHAVASMLGQGSPGIEYMVAVCMLAAVAAVAFVVMVAYYTSVTAFRLGGDPDTYGIPLVTSSVDFIGAAALVSAVLALGLG